MNCDPIARWYRWLEYIIFGPSLELRRFTFLREVRDARRILILGEGDGRFLAKLLQQDRVFNNRASGDVLAIDCVDLSAKMLELARKRAGEDCIAYHRADARTIPLGAAEYDLIVTHFFLDCFDEADAAALVEKLAATARPRAQWLISEFRDPWWAHWFISGLYFFFRLTTGLRTRYLVDHRPLLSRAGFHMTREATSAGEFLASELWVFEDARGDVQRQ